MLIVQLLPVFCSTSITFHCLSVSSILGHSLLLYHDVNTDARPNFPLSKQTFVLHPSLSSEPLTAGTALTILALFNLLSGPLQLLTLVSAAVANASVSSRRLMPLLLAEEVSRYPSPSMASRRFTTIVIPDPTSEVSVSHIFQIFMKKEEIPMFFCFMMIQIFCVTGRLWLPRGPEDMP